MTTPFSLRIFVADGDPDGLRIVERSNWIGKAVVFPRALLPRVKQREEFGQAGVYLLIGPREDGEGEMLYVGEGDPVGDRLVDHHSKKEFWSRAVFFVAGNSQLNKAHVQYLEAQLIRRAKAAKRMPLDNVNQPSEPSLSEADLADMGLFLDNLLGILPVMEVHAFEQVGKRQAQNTILVCQGKGTTAKGYEATQGFVVQQGSLATGETAPSMTRYVRRLYDLRTELIENGVLAKDGDHYRFTQDYSFSSPSTAAAVVLGRNANGRTEWKDSKGRTLKTLQELEAQSASGGAS
jgi:hypothetical protein